MADINEKVLAMVEKEIRADPNVSNDELRAKAEKIDSSISKLGPRQFNARYPLQVKRRLAPKKPRRARRKSGGTRKATAGKGRARNSAASSPNEPVRAVLLDFARDVAAADGKAQIVDLIAGVDKYVDRVVKAAGQ